MKDPIDKQINESMVVLNRLLAQAEDVFRQGPRVAAAVEIDRDTYFVFKNSNKGWMFFIERNGEFNLPGSTSRRERTLAAKALPALKKQVHENMLKLREEVLDAIQAANAFLEENPDAEPDSVPPPRDSNASTSGS